MRTHVHSQWLEYLCFELKTTHRNLGKQEPLYFPPMSSYTLRLPGVSALRNCLTIPSQQLLPPPILLLCCWLKASLGKGF